MNSDLFKKIHFSDSLVRFLSSFNDMIEDKHPTSEFYLFISSIISDIQSNLEEINK